MLGTAIRERISILDEHIAFGKYYTAASLLNQLENCIQKQVDETLRSDVESHDLSRQNWNSIHADTAYRRGIVVDKLRASALRSSRSIEQVRKCVSSIVNAGGIRCHTDASKLLIECYSSRNGLSMKTEGGI